MSPLNLTNVAANYQNYHVLFSDKKFWRIIQGAKFLEIPLAATYVAANSQKLIFCKFPQN